MFGSLYHAAAICFESLQYSCVSYLKHAFICLYCVCLLRDSRRIKCREINSVFVHLVFGNALRINLFLFEFQIFLLYDLLLDSRDADLYSTVVPRSLREVTLWTTSQ